MTEISQGRANPYVGPRAFKPGERLYGRDREVLSLLDLLIAERIVLLYSPSGAGKTSLIQAALLLELEKKRFDILPVMRVSLEPPPDFDLPPSTNRYLLSLLLSLEAGASSSPPMPLADLANMSLATYLNRRYGSDGESRRLILIFDQFEEIFVHPIDQAAKSEFFAEVGAVLEDRRRWALFAMREDYLAGLDAYRVSVPTRLRATFRLELLGVDAARQAIREPARQMDVDFTEAAAKKLVDDLRRTRVPQRQGVASQDAPCGPYVEPVQLQVVCQSLWQDLPPDVSTITEEHLQSFGDVNQALSDFYEHAVQVAVQSSGVEEAALRNWFSHTLITPLQTRGTVFRGDESTGDIPNAAVDALEAQHVIRAEYRAGARWYELTHDRFIEPIVASNEAWRVAMREAMKNVLTEPAREWERLGRDEGSLLRGARLEEAVRWAEAHEADLDELEREFLKASLALQTREKEEAELHRRRELEARARRARIYAAMSILMGVLLLIAAWAFVIAVQQRNAAQDAEAEARLRRDEAAAIAVVANQRSIDAEQARAVAIAAEREATSGRLAAQAITSLESDPQLSLLLAVESISVTHTVEAEDALRQALQASRTRAVLSGHLDRVNAVDFSRDGKLLATGGADGSVRLWDVNGDERDVLMGHMDSVVAVAFSRDGRRLFTSSADGESRLWSVSPVTTTAMISPTGRVTAVAFSDGGRILATGSDDGSVRVWDLTSPITAPIILTGHTDGISAMTLGFDGRRLATASLDGTVRLWDVETYMELAVLSGHKSGVNAVAFSPDGHWLVTGGADGTARLWEATSGAELAVLRGHLGSILTVAFDPSGSLLATGSADSTVRLWDIAAAIQPVDDSPEIALLRGHTDQVNDVEFSLDGKLLATASADSTAQLWDISTTYGSGSEPQSILRGHTSSVNVVVFSPDGSLLATASSDGTARLWEVGGGEAQTVLSGQGRKAYELAFSPDGSLLAASSYSFEGALGVTATVRLWDVPLVLQSANPRELAVLSIPNENVYGAVVSPDGNLLATSGTGATLTGTAETTRLWDISSVRGSDVVSEVVTLRVDAAGPPAGAAFSPDRSLLVTGGQDGIARLWNVAALLVPGSDMKPVAELRKHGGAISDIAISPDDRHLLATSSSDDATIRLWDISVALKSGGDGAQVAILPGHESGIAQVTFSPDGSLLASTSADSTARLWDVARALETGGRDAEVAVLRGHESGWVVGVAFSPNGDLLTTGGPDNTARLWDVQAALETAGTSGVVVAVLRGHGDRVLGVAFSPDGRWLATSSLDETIRLWAVKAEDLITSACRHATRNLTQDEWDRYFGRDVAYRRTCPNLSIHPTVALQYARQGQIAAALDALREAAELDSTLKPESEVANVLVELGQQRARQGEIDDALAALRQAAKLDPARNLNPEAEIARLLVDEGRSYGNQGDYEQALAALRQAAELDPTLELVPEVELARLLADLGVELDPAPKSVPPEVVATAQVLAYARQGEIDSALAAMRRAAELNPALEPALMSAVAGTLADLGRSYAYEGEYDRALSTMRQALKLDPTLDLVPEAVVALAQAQEYVYQGKVDEALTAYRKAVELDPSSTDEFVIQVADALAALALDQSYEGKYEEATDVLLQVAKLTPRLEADQASNLAYYYNEVCWSGNLNGQAETVLPVCGQAVELAPDDGAIRDSRGLARALTGDYSGAIEDFKFFVEWSKKPSAFARNVPWREAWIAELEAGRNPFDEATLEALRGE